MLGGGWGSVSPPSPVSHMSSELQFPHLYRCSINAKCSYPESCWDSPPTLGLVGSAVHAENLVKGEPPRAAETKDHNLGCGGAETTEMSGVLEA